MTYLSCNAQGAIKDKTNKKVNMNDLRKDLSEF